VATKHTIGGFRGRVQNLRVTPHVAQNLERLGGSAIDGRTTQHAGYAINQRKCEKKGEA